MLGVTFALVGAGGIAHASIPGPDGTINACYKPSDGKLFVIDSSASCPNGTTSLSWPSRMSALTTQSVQNFSGDVAPGDRATAIAACPDGWRLTGGGFDTNTAGEGSEAPTQIITSLPAKESFGQAWVVTAVNPDSNTSPHGVTAYAVCTQLQ